MTENIQITLIVVGAILIVLLVALWMFKDRLDIFSFAASKNRISAKMERHQNTGITISGNTQDGNENEITAEAANATIEMNLQQGDENLIRAATTSQNNKKKT